MVTASLDMIERQSARTKGLARFPLDHRQHRGDRPTHVGRRQQGSRPGLFLRHDHQAPETTHAGSGPDSPTITICASIPANRKGP